MHDPSRTRRALAHIGGRITTAGDAADANRLAHALDVAPTRDFGDPGDRDRDRDGRTPDTADDPARLHVHGFHTYPARLHPQTAARLVTAFVPPGGRVLDPFCGSGTILVEAMISGRVPLGTDLNPLAVRLARCKTRPRDGAELDQLVARAKDVAAFADDRRKAKAGASRRFPPEDVTLFEPHVLLELDSLRTKLEMMGHDPARFDLSLILSAVLVKLSGKRGDTSAAVTRRRTAAGFAAKLFVQKTEDYARRLAEFRDLLPTPPPARAFVGQDDATQLRTLPAGRIDAIVTSPPYAATYDYVSHHALRLRWLKLDVEALTRGEIGSRSSYRGVKPADAPRVWAGELAKFFAAAARVLPPGGPLVLVMADSGVGGVALRADEIVADVARRTGFAPAACASQPRPHFHSPSLNAFRDRPRAEHAILLRKTGESAAPDRAADVRRVTPAGRPVITPGAG